MPYSGLMDCLPLWAVFPVTVVLVGLSLEIGFRLGRWRLQRAEPEKEAAVGPMVGATLGLLAFMLAFSFGMAASRFDDRRRAFLDEVNAIGTAYLRAELLPEPHGTEVRKLLREYVDVRLAAAQAGRIDEALRRSEELHGRLWAQAVAVGAQHPGSIVAGLFIQALNEVIDLHTTRVVVGLRSRIPEILWLVLYAITVAGMAALGYHAGLTGTSRSLAAIGVALTFSAVIFLIADLDRPREGSLTVSQQAMVELRNTMGEPSP